MSDLDLVRSFRSDAPAEHPLPPIDFAAAGTAGTAAAAVESARRGRTTPWLAAAAVVVATGTLVALQSGPAAPPSRAAALLERAATTVKAAGAPRPGDRQWLYYSTAATTAPGVPFDPDPALRGYGWVTFDGSRYADASSDDLSDVSVATVEPELLARNATPESDYDAATALPSAPDALLDALADSELADPDGDSAAARDFDAVADVLARRLLPSPTLADLFRALATIPGVDVDLDAPPDLLGRAVVAITFEGDGADGMRVRSELLLDPTTYAFLGSRTTALEAGEVWAGQHVVEPGEVVEDRAVVGPILVDRPGDVVDPLTGEVTPAADRRRG
ncbi:CU044_5270 family protein [Nocardioides sp. SOB77]|uniref:CU044_5270 family protein n=1 Tax=Nocardioides oceani TaxID=3058369 RepID=A0ABT8FHI1_9ACTN|nr:CU044_5270 family protein [Nocardioides oceani]MDN4173980.1 CU044_5270 family protein [Nocardioides oceani]